MRKGGSKERGRSEGAYADKYSKWIGLMKVAEGDCCAPSVCKLTVEGGAHTDMRTYVHTAVYTVCINCLTQM